MFCILWVIFQALAVVVEGGVSSGSAEALANGGVMNNGGTAAGNGAKAGAQNGVPLNGEPIVGRLVQLGGSLFLQPLGNSVIQASLQQLIPITTLQQGAAVVAGQAGGASVNVQGQMAQQAAGGGPVVLYTVLPGGDPQQLTLTPGQVQLISVPGMNAQQQLSGAAAGGISKGRARFQRSAAARLRRTQTPVVKEKAAEEEEEEEECSGNGAEEKEIK